MPGPSSGCPDVAMVFREHSGRVYRYLLRRTNDPVLAEELTQRVFHDAVVAFSTVEIRGSTIQSWLYRVAERRFADELRHRYREQPSDDMERGAGADDLGYPVRVGRALREGISSLSPEQRDVVVKHLLQGRPYAEIAGEAGVSEEACKMRFLRAMQALRAYLTDVGVDP